jgi:hypothetical protein
MTKPDDTGAAGADAGTENRSAEGVRTTAAAGVIQYGDGTDHPVSNPQGDAVVALGGAVGVAARVAAGAAWMPKGLKVAASAW